jgi:hypothetical protein
MSALTLSAIMPGLASGGIALGQPALAHFAKINIGAPGFGNRVARSIYWWMEGI